MKRTLPAALPSPAPAPPPNNHEARALAQMLSERMDREMQLRVELIATQDKLRAVEAELAALKSNA